MQSETPVVPDGENGDLKQPIKNQFSNLNTKTQIYGKNKRARQ
jgi:hypothetical protein